MCLVKPLNPFFQFKELDQHPQKHTSLESNLFNFGVQKLPFSGHPVHLRPTTGMLNGDVMTHFQLSPFHFLPHKIVEKILALLPLEVKKNVRKVCRDWNTAILQLLTIRIPAMSDSTVRNIARFGQEVCTVRISSLILPIPAGTPFVNGHKVKTLVFEDPEISPENMAWVLSKCYSVKMIRIQLGEDSARSFKKLCLFLKSETTQILNSVRRTLKSLELIGILGNTATTTPEKWSFDCSILRDCSFLQSFIIISLPFLELRNIQLLPASLAHLALEEVPIMNPSRGKDSSPPPLPPSKKLVSFGFIDFSSQIPLRVKTFQYVIRLTRLKRLIQTPLDGQGLFEALTPRTVSTVAWSGENNRYQLNGTITLPSSQI